MSANVRKKVKEPVVLALVFASALVAGLVIWLMARGAKPDKDGYLKWMLGGMGGFGVLLAVFDREQKPDLKRINRVNAIQHLLGPMGSRVMWAVIGGAFLGGAIALFTYHA